MEVFFVVWFFAAAMFAGLGAWVAIQKHRRPEEGLILGAIYGPLGVIVEGQLPAIEQSNPLSSLSLEEKRRLVEGWQRASEQRKAKKAELDPQVAPNLARQVDPRIAGPSMSKAKSPWPTAP